MVSRTLRSVRALAWRGALATTALAALLGLGHRLDPVGQGLSATYFDDSDWSPSSLFATREDHPSTEELIGVWKADQPENFSATWQGSLLVLQDGAYTVSTISDDGSWVYIDGVLVVDNGGQHAPITATGIATLTRGVHAIFVKYMQAGGGVRLDLLWAHGEESLHPIPPWAFAPRPVAFRPFLISAWLRWGLAGAEWLSFAVIVFAGLLSASPLPSAARRWLERRQAWPALGWIIAASLVINVAAIWWGLPEGSWAGDEVAPDTVIEGASQFFSHGWVVPYPLFHYYVLAAAFSPLLVLKALGRIDLVSVPVYTILVLVERIVSIAAGVGTVVAVYACGRYAFNRRAGLWAAAMFGLVAPFVYYAKTGNLDVPYLFWFAASLFFYLRAMDRLAVGDFIGLAVCAALAVVTKDQAYGLYVLVPFAMVYRLWMQRRMTEASHPLPGALLDRRLWIAASVAGALFVAGFNLLFNWTGFLGHLDLITGGLSQGFRMFDPTATGRFALLRLTTDLIRVSWGWPMFFVAVAGVGVVFSLPQYRRVAVWLAVPAVSYYVFFIDVVLYNYDRFVLPICLVLALYGGAAIEHWLRPPGRWRSWQLAAIGAIFAYTIVYTTPVDVMMQRDGRYAVEQWMASHIGRDDLVGFVFPSTYYPRLENFRTREVPTIEKLQLEPPAFFVLNADYARSERPDRPIGQLIAALRGGELGYRLEYRFRRPTPWPWSQLPGGHRDLLGVRQSTMVYSSLRHINPTIEIFRRQH